jgi:hypothetical protein
MDGATGSSEAVGDDGASSRRVVNGDDAANHCAARRGVTEGGVTRQRRRGRAWPGHAGQGTDDGKLLCSERGRTASAVIRCRTIDGT